MGTWDAANVPNVGYVARLLNEYYPHTNEPTALTNLDQKAAAVQAAIWFFSDRYVLSTSDPLRKTVVAIVNRVRSLGPLVQPPAPSLTLKPAIVSGAAGTVLGPFTVTTDHPPATVTVTGGSVFSNAAGTAPIADGAGVPSGQKIWIRSSVASVAVLQATSRATVPGGNVYLYDGNTHGVNDAQKLILAETAELTSTVKSTAEFLAPGSLNVKKTIAGQAAGSQGAWSFTWTAVTASTGPTSSSLPVRPRVPTSTPTRTSRLERCAPSPRLRTAASSVSTSW